MSSIIERIGAYIKHKDMPISKVETLIGVSGGTLSKPLRSNKNIKTDTLEKFLNHFQDINPAWLMNGDGEMILDRNKITEEEKDRILIFNAYKESSNDLSVDSYNTASLINHALISNFCEEFPNESEGYTSTLKVLFSVKLLQKMVNKRRADFYSLGIIDKALFLIDRDGIENEDIIYEKLKAEFYPKLSELMSDSFYKDLKKLDKEIGQFKKKYFVESEIAEFMKKKTIENVR